MRDEKKLNEIEARANAATPGPWFSDRRALYSQVTAKPNGMSPFIATAEAADDAVASADAEFIANARTDVPALVAEVRRLQAELSTTVDPARLPPLWFASITDYPDEGSHIVAAIDEHAADVVGTLALGANDVDEPSQVPNVTVTPCDPHALVAEIRRLRARVAELEGIREEQAEKLRRHLNEIAEARRSYATVLCGVPSGIEQERDGLAAANAELGGLLLNLRSENYALREEVDRLRLCVVAAEKVMRAAGPVGKFLDLARTLMWPEDGEPKAPNHVTADMVSPDGRKMTLTVQAFGGKTPAEAMEEVVEERDALKARVAELEVQRATLCECVLVNLHIVKDCPTCRGTGAVLVSL